MIAFLLPGQGSQRPGLLKDCVDALGARDLFQHASELLGIDVLRNDDARALEDTEVIQRNVFLAGVAAARSLEGRDVFPCIIAGHSIGAFAAAAVAGVFSFDDALEMVTVRGRAMATSVGSGNGMGAVLGLLERDVRAIVGEVQGNDTVDIAGINAIDQVVVSGTLSGVNSVLAIASLRGARNVRLLSVPTASHTVQLIGVRDRLYDAFSSIAIRTPRVPVAGNVDGRALFNARDVVNDLIEGVAKPVRWFDAMQMLYERGTTCFVESFLSDTLTTIAETAFPEVTAVSLGRSGLEATSLLARKYG